MPRSKLGQGSQEGAGAPDSTEAGAALELFFALLEVLPFLMNPTGDWTPLTATDICRVWRLNEEGKPVQQQALPDPQKLIFLR